MHLGVVDSHLSPVIVEAALLLPCSLPLLTRDSSSDRSWLCGQGVLSWANCPWPTAGSITGNTGSINSNPGSHGDGCEGTQLAQNTTECHFLFLSNEMFFSNIAY